MSDEANKPELESTDTVDCICIGTSPILIMEASYQTSLGKTVLMIDNKDRIGGSWAPVDIFGLHDVENAIHYFLQHPVGFSFMKDVLGLNVIKSEKKHRVFVKPCMGIKSVSYDNLWGRMVSEYRCGESTANPVSKFFSAIFDTLKTANRTSVYVKGGSVEIINYIKALIEKFQIKILLSTQISAINIDHNKELVTVTVSDVNNESGSRTLKGKKLFISHGTKLDKLDGTRGELMLKNQVHPRPAAHILVNDESTENAHELIFMENPLIKYVHDISQFTREGESMSGKQKVLVIALQNDVSEYPELYQNILELCIKGGILGKDATLVDSHWWDIYLPSLGNQDLIEACEKYHPMVEWLSTENFSEGIGLRSSQWVSALK